MGYYSVQDDVVVMHDESGKPTGKRMPAGEYPRQVAYLMTREILEGEGTGLQSSAQLSTVGACLSKGSPRRNLEKTTGANRVWSEGSCDLSRCRSQWPASEVKRNG